MRIAVVTAGLSNPSSTRVLADELAAATRRQLGGHVEIDVIELREHAHALVDNLLTGFPNAALKQAIEQVGTADGLIAVTPIFTASYNALFKAFFDVLDKDAIVGMPVLIGATGGSERHSLALEHALRPLFGYLRAMVVPTTVYAASADFGARGGDTAGLAARIDRAAGELAGLIKAGLRKPVEDPYVDVVPFEALLGNAG
ncbi:MAG TPA: FMN reductase [Pseudonocardiaceae bacterium]|jgi:FMN reductase|nr:FMN reductase [Pseudonocardiaceae bacterium]